MSNTTSSVFRAQGSLTQYSPIELLNRLAQLGFTGRLSLVSEDSPRRVVTLHLEHGEPVLAVGSGIPTRLSESDEAWHSRQAFLEALCWEFGRFSLAEGQPGAVSRKHKTVLVSSANLMKAANQRQEIWTECIARLPGPLATVKVAGCGDAHHSDDPIAILVCQTASSEPTTIVELSLQVRNDLHLVLQSVINLAAESKLVLSAPETDTGLVAHNIEQTILHLLQLLQPGGTSGRTLKVTVLSWDSATIFRAVEALQGRRREPPEAVDDSPRYQVISETLELKERVQLEILAFREDAFEPDFCAPLVQDCHVFLLFSDLESDHSADEAPLVERINRVRSMFSGVSLAGRVTVGATAETDPGCDVLLPELARFFSWEAAQRPEFLAELLAELISRLE